MAVPDPKDETTLTFDENTSVTVHLHGATVTSWKCKGDEQLFLSKNAVFDNKKAIRGGIPIVFPNFGPWEFGPQHGFARSSRWAVHTMPQKHEDGSVTAVFTLKDTVETRKMWNHKFRLKYKLTLKIDSFSMDFRVENTGSEAFEFTCLLHTYFHVPDVKRTGILCLKGLGYIDKVKGDNELHTEESEIVHISTECDRIYINDKKEIPGEVCLIDGSIFMKLVQINFPDTVVWNPWREGARKMSDFGDDEYLNMVCVESGHVHTPYKLEPGKTFKANQTFLS